VGSAGAAGSVPGTSEPVLPRWLRPLVIVLAVAVIALGAVAALLTFRGGQSVDPTSAAIARWEQQVAEHPGDGDARRGLALAYQQAGRYTDALVAYQRVVDLAPDDLGSRYNLGVVQIAVGDPEAGETTLRAVLAQAPDHVLAAKTLAERLLAREEYAEALAVLEPASASRPELADLQYDAGLALEWLGRTAEAIERYRAALRYAPDLQSARDGLERLGVTP